MPAAAASVFATVQLVVLLSSSGGGGDVDSPAQRLEHDEARRRFSAGGASNVLFYADAPVPERGVLGCCLRGVPDDPEHRLEQTYASALAHAPTGVSWFVFTEGDTWWHMPNLASEISRIEAKIAPATAATEFIVAGGGGFIVFSCFSILSRPAVRYLADGATLDGCREKLLRCEPYPKNVSMPNEFAQMRAVGCHASGPISGRRQQQQQQEGGGGAIGAIGASTSTSSGRGSSISSSSSTTTTTSGLYAAKDLLNYCAAEPLARGRCGSKGVGCEWRFGQLARDQDTAKEALPAATVVENWKAGIGPPSPNEKGGRSPFSIIIVQSMNPSHEILIIIVHHRSSSFIIVTIN